MTDAKPIATNYDFLNSSRITNLPDAQAGQEPITLSQAQTLFTRSTLLSGLSDPDPEVGQNGDFYINRSTGHIFGPKESNQWPSGVSLLVSVPPKAITIDSPRVGDEFTLFYTQYPTIFTQVLGVIRGTDASATFELRYSSDRSSVGTSAIDPLTITNTTSGELAVVKNMPIPVNNFLWVKITQISGTVLELNVSVEV